MFTTGGFSDPVSHTWILLVVVYTTHLFLLETPALVVKPRSYCLVYRFVSYSFLDGKPEQLHLYPTLHSKIVVREAVRSGTNLQRLSLSQDSSLSMPVFVHFPNFARYSLDSESSHN